KSGLTVSDAEAYDELAARCLTYRELAAGAIEFSPSILIEELFEGRAPTKCESDLVRAILRSRRPGHERIAVQLSDKEIATLVSCSTRTVWRVIARLEEAGIIVVFATRRSASNEEKEAGSAPTLKA